jgi:hypothetical protein
MPILAQKAGLLATVETTPGIAVNANSAHTVVVADPMWAIESEEVTRSLTRGDFSGFPSIFAQRRATLTFKTEVRGSGTAVTAPDWAVLLRGCGFFPSSVVAGTPLTIAASPSGLVRQPGGMTSVVTTTLPHGLTTGQFVVIAGATATFNGTFQVLDTPTTTTFRIANLRLAKASKPARTTPSAAMKMAAVARLENASMRMSSSRQDTVTDKRLCHPAKTNFAIQQRHALRARLPKIITARPGLPAHGKEKAAYCLFIKTRAGLRPAPVRDQSEYRQACGGAANNAFNYPYKKSLLS